MAIVPIDDGKRAKPLVFPGRTDSSIYTGVPCPYLNDDEEIEMPVRSSVVTTQELYYWMEQDFPGIFAVRTLNEEAFAFWTQDTEPDNTDESEAHKERIMQALNYAVGLGFSCIVYYDDQPDLKMPLKEDSPILRFDTFPPYYDKYGISKWDLDKNNRPERFYIKYGDVHGNELVVDASRVTLIVWNKTTPDWRGLALMVGCKDDVRDYWYWRRVLGERASTRAKARYVFNKLSGGTWTPAELTSVDDAMEGIPHACISNAQVSPVGSDLTDGEILQTLDALREAIAVQIGVNISDFRGAEIGENPSTDSRNTRLTRTLRKRQNWAQPYVEEIYKKMGWEFKGFNPPWETPPEVQDKSVLALSDAMQNNTDKDVKELLKGRILAIYKGVLKAELNEIEPKPTEIGFGEGGPNENGPGGQSRENGSPADRARDRRALNRTRQDNAAAPR